MNCAVILSMKQITDTALENIQTLLKKNFFMVLILQNKSTIDRRLVRLARDHERCLIIFKDNQKNSFLLIKDIARQLREAAMNRVVILSKPYCMEDIEKAATALAACKHTIILGTRTDHTVESRLATLLFNILYGTKLTDIQSGLLAMSLDQLEEICMHSKSIWDFEVYALIKKKQMQTEIVEVPIHEHKTSRTFNDIIRTYLTIISGFLGYSFSTIVAAIVDITLFTLLSGVVFINFPLKSQIFLSNAIARIASSFCDFSISRKYVFGNRNSMAKSMIKYYVLWLTLLSASSMIVYLGKKYMGSNLVLTKLLADLLLGIISYQVQLRWVFKNTER